MSKRAIFGVAIAVAIIVGGYYLVQARQASQSAGQFQTVRADRGDLVGTVGATGTVRANQTAILTWLTSGTVDTVHVKVGDIVSTGDILAELRPSSLSQNIILAQADLVTAKRNLDNLIKSNTAWAQAQVAVINAQKAVDDALKTVDNLEGKRASQEVIDNAEAKYVLALENVERAQRAFDFVAELPSNDPDRAAAFTSLFQAKLQRDRALAEWNWYLGQPSDDDLSEAQVRLDLAEAQLEDARREADRLKDGPDPDDISAAQARVTAIQTTLNLAQISAPFKGTISSVTPMPGDLVSPGVAAFRLDDLSRHLVDVQIPEVDINSVTVGQTVTVTFDAILGKEFKGVITQVSRVGNSVQGTVNFSVVVELQELDETVRPGMTAAVNILVRELKDVLLVPNRAVRLIEGQRVVYILKDGTPQQVRIRLGASSDTVSEVISGDLKEGDMIIINPPSIFGPGGPGPFGGG